MRNLGTVALALAALGACVESTQVETDVAALGPGGGNREQGRFLLGELADALPGRNGSVFVSVQLSASLASGPATLSVTAPAITGPCLHAWVGGIDRQCADGVFVGAVLRTSGSAAPRLRIVGALTFVTPGSPGQPMTGYRLEYNAAWPASRATWVPYCVDGRLAYPIAGEVTRRGEFVRGEPAITFACSEFMPDGSMPTARAQLTGNGVAGKAMSWGFVPGADGVDWEALPVTGVDLHATAVAAGRAAYCGDGESHTIDATSIEISDLVTGNLVSDTDPAAWPAPLPGETSASQPFLVESAWKRGVGNVPPVPVCLSRLRWQSLPVGNRCVGANLLQDPRASASDRVYFCDDKVLADLARFEAVTIVHSQQNDVGLWQWGNTTTGDRYTTGEGSYGGTRSTTAPAPGYAVTSSAALEGIAFTAVGVEVFTANYGAGAGTFVELMSCQRPAGTDWATDLPSWLNANGYVHNCKSEGFVWSTPPSDRRVTALGMSWVRLRRWSNGTDRVAAVARPAIGYAATGTIGWIVAPAAW